MVSMSLPLMLLGLAVYAEAYAEYAELLPNGDKVPGVAAVGHTKAAGGGANNQFGIDFSTAGSTWSSVLCQLDSDGDGATNGEELGDPCCTWKQGTTPHSSTATSPGHKNSFTAAQLAALKCPSSTTSAPTAAPTTAPTSSPPLPPTKAPSPAPSPVPSPAPSPVPSPSTSPSSKPKPTEDPTDEPSDEPTDDPSDEPSDEPTDDPTPSPLPTNSTTPTNPPNTDCVKISVQGDATYCIAGPICVGASSVPAGRNCPTQGDVAGQDCVPGIPSYANGNCVLKTNTVCQQMTNGAWGCVLPSSPAEASDAAETPKVVKMATAASMDNSGPDYTMVAAISGTVAAVAAVAMAVLITKKVRRAKRFDGPSTDIQHNAETPVL
ncbi:hypothetical protein ACHHYP_04993 [Achlya hypogyna]|uniref:Temptin Cys/Cys disulfide domain-containing protein n=1 Tax=Achlya hypogyna TaxID=1202772 RepID=A0A1V9YZ48_ACHHY|nr:hypothetical protein ACHHYP_04993 [Achlya hypogyna]